jgi:hypothetical protein
MLTLRVADRHKWGGLSSDRSRSWPYATSELEPATVTATQPSFEIEDGFGVLTGRVAVDQGGPINPFIVAMVEGRGDAFAAIKGVPVNCIGAGPARAFEWPGYTDMPPDPELGDVYAYPTTVRGAGDSDTPPNC